MHWLLWQHVEGSLVNEDVSLEEVNVVSLMKESIEVIFSSGSMLSQ